MENEGLLNLAYKVPILTYGPLHMVALFALARRGHPARLMVGTMSLVIAALVLRPLKAIDASLL